MDTTDRVRDLVAPLVAAIDADLYDIEYQGGILRVTLSGPDGVDLDVIASLTRDLSRLLDDQDPIAGQYTLEVSSPGLERTLRRPEHYAGAIGSTVSVKLRGRVDGDRRVRGTLTAADDDVITIEASASAGDPGEVRQISLADVERARTVFEWGPSPKPGSPRAAQPSAKQKKAGKS